jgi:hypothetical protein
VAEAEEVKSYALAKARAEIEQHKPAWTNENLGHNPRFPRRARSSDFTVVSRR